MKGENVYDQKSFDEVMQMMFFNNHIKMDEWEGGFAYIVRREEEEGKSLLGGTFEWLSANTTDEWSKFMGGMYVFRSKQDALMFKLVWG